MCYNTSSKIIIIGAALLMAACTNQQGRYAANDAVFKNLDTTVKPGTDFFNYASGAWLKRNPIPAAYASWGIGNVVQDELRDKLRKISEDAMNNPAEQGSNSQKIGDFYFTGMDTLGIEKQGISPLKPEIDRINAIKDVNNLLDVFAHLQTIGVQTAMGPSVQQDDKNSSKMVLKLYQDGLGLPNRDYYFNTDEQTTKIRTDYQQKHLPTVLTLAGLSATDAAQAAAQIYTLEKFLADSSRKLEDLRDPYKNYNKVPLAGLSKWAPLVNWPKFISNCGYTNVDSVIVGQPEYYRAVNTALTRFPIAVWKQYLLKNLVEGYSNSLSKAFVNESFRFYGTVIRGRKAQLPRWKQVLDHENSLMGELLGQLYVKTYFNEKAKQRYVNLVEAMRQTFKEHIEHLSWMSAPTKQKALYKLSKIIPKVGYPDKWKDFSKLSISRKAYATNVLNANLFWHQYEASKLGKPVDRTEWDMTPQTYNAYYNPSNNEIVLPAAIFMIPGVADEDVDDAVVYGYAAASTIGHEMTHGFDDQGRQFDASGNLKSWWTAQDSAQFTRRAQMLVDQFSGYVVNGQHVNGKATQGENIADLGGIVLGLDAFKKTEQYKAGKTINGLTPTQRYFLGYALGWLGHDRKESLATQLLTDVHAPGFLRVNGPFTDVDEFYKAFNIKKGDKMWLDPAKRVVIW